MFEVIWSVFSNAFVAREIAGLSRVRAQFTGTLNECNEWIAANK
jgi:hypothetical protein